MKFVDRFIDFTSWPTSRKTLVLACASIPLLFVAVGYVHFSAFTDARFFKPELLAWISYSWLVVQVVIALIALPLARANKEAQWTAWLQVGVSGPLVAVLMYLFGTMSSFLVAVYPAVVILWTIFYSQRIGWFSFALISASLVILHVLESTGVLPFAPILLDRIVDGQNTTLWFASVMFGMAALLVLVLVPISLILAARQRQESMLRQMHDELGKAAQHLEQSNKLIRRYVPSQVAEQIITDGYAGGVRPERRKLTIFFSEVEGFTNATDELDPEELSTALNEYLSAMIAIAEQYGATVNPLVGDELMMFFGAPKFTNDRDHALRAVHMALDMHKNMRALQQIWDRRGIQQPFRIRMGINTGYASVGDFGSEGRKLYSGIGVQTSLAQKIQRRCEPGRILLSASTWALVQDEVPCAPKGEISAKGVHYPVQVYEVNATG